ncbi:unnamed protein product [Blepharisma stoltei]|uniref:Uncharacterized protein n=1 Tax=Blepharisma stoltei TaxID=1481888 RepID=A0AAU9J9F6_9CILI|nr:unnamed protein product [Blepharisma stoltei]
MDELVTCSINCQNKPIFVCDCSDKNVFLCLNHVVAHGESDGKHHFTRIMKSPDPKTIIIIFEFIKGLKLRAKQDRWKIVKESSALIKQINETTEKALEKIFLIEKKLDEYVYLCETLEEVNNLNSNSFIESALKLSPESAAKIKCQEDIIKINNSSLKKRLKNLFTVKDPKSLFDIDNFEASTPKKVGPIIKYFKSQTLFAVDVISLNSASQNINKNFIQWDPTCLLNDGSVFCCFQSETFIIDPNNSIIALDSSRYSYNSGLIAVDDFVYMFGGDGNASLKFSLKSKNWTELSLFPGSMVNNTCTFINWVILILGFTSPDILCYNILNNSYSYAPITLNSNAGKICLTAKSKVYIISNRSCYESGLNDINTWASIGTTNVFEEYHGRHSYSLLYEDSFYFITTDYGFIQFDLSTKQLKRLKTL